MNPWYTHAKALVKHKGFFNLLGKVMAGIRLKHIYPARHCCKRPVNGSIGSICGTERVD